MVLSPLLQRRGKSSIARMLRHPATVSGLLAVGIVAIVMHAQNLRSANELLVKERAPVAAFGNYVSGEKASKELSSYFDNLDDTLKGDISQMLTVSEAKKANTAVAQKKIEKADTAVAQKSMDTVLAQKKAELAREKQTEQKLKMDILTEEKQKHALAQKTSQQLVEAKKHQEMLLLDKGLAEEKSKVENLKKQKEMLEHQFDRKDKNGKLKGAPAESLRWKTYPLPCGPGSASGLACASRYAYTIEDKEKPVRKGEHSGECLPPQVLLDGECLNYLTMSTEQQAEARKALRKNAYYRYRWLYQPHKHGYKHLFRVIPRRYPHDDGMDLGDNLVGLDCGKPDCRESYLDDKYRKYPSKYPKARIPKLFRPFVGDGMDVRFATRPEVLKKPIKIANGDGKFTGTIDKALADAFSDPKFGASVYLDQFHPAGGYWDVMTHPTRQDRFRPLSSLSDRARNYPKGGGASRGQPGWHSPTVNQWAGSVSGAPGTRTPSSRVVSLVHPTAPPGMGEGEVPSVVLGPKTLAEKVLLDGTGEVGDGGEEGLFGDERLPAEGVLEDQDQDAFKHAHEGEPLTDAAMNNWDMFNGVADP